MNQLPLQFPSGDQPKPGLANSVPGLACSGFFAHGPDLIPKLAQFKAQGLWCWRLAVDGVTYRGDMAPVVDSRSLATVTEAVRTVRPVAVRWNGMHLEPIR